MSGDTRRSLLRRLGLRRPVMLGIGLAGVAVVSLAAFGGVRAYRFVEEDPSLCRSCHTMEEAWQQWETGEHKDVTCHSCHEGDAVTSLRQVWTYITRRPDEVHTQCDGVELYYTQRSVTTREWKYVYNGFDDDELYHLPEDPHEMRNLALDPKYDGAKREMVRRMWRFAHREEDTAMNPYGTVALCPWGPGEAFA